MAEVLELALNKQKKNLQVSKSYFRYAFLVENNT